MFLGFLNCKGINGPPLTQYLKIESFLGIDLFLKFHQHKISFLMMHSIMRFLNINFPASETVG